MTPGRRSPSPGSPPPAATRPPSELSSESSSELSPADRSTELVALIRAEIEGAPGRRITFARFMERALYEPELGYYRQLADRPTDAGDFLTAPETHAIFGWTLTRRIESMWAELGRPRPFHLVEYGAGSGTLALSILDGLRRHVSTELLEAVGLQDRAAHKPGELSGGEQQRVAVARALVLRPRLLLADEPTGNLDLHTGEQIIAMLSALSREQGVTVITATHDHKMLASSDRVVWVKDGAIARVERRENLNIKVGSIDGQTVA